METTRRLHLNTNVTALGRHPAGWRFVDNPNAIVDLRFFQDIARLAERGKLDALFLSDSVAVKGPAEGPSQFLEPTVLLTALSSCTRNLGLIGTASTTFNDPFNLARRFSSVDHLTGGRVALNVVTSYDLSAAANFSLSHTPEKQERYERAREFVDVVFKLWDSWEDGALAADTKSGLYADPARIHAISHRGKYFQVEGPLNVPRSPQGRPVLIQAGGSEGGVDLAAARADAVFTAQTTLRDGKNFYAGIKRRASQYGRNPDHVLILPGLFPVIGGTQAEAHARKKEMDALLDWERITAGFARVLGLDIDDLKLDQPLPYEKIAKVTRSDQSQGFVDATVQLGRAENLTVRELLDRNPGAHRIVVGTPEQVADTIQQWFEERAADGFNLNADVFPSGLEAVVDHVVPILQKRGIFRRDYEGTTLRDNLGLPRPLSQYATH